MKKILFGLFIIIFSTIGYSFADLAGYTIQNFDIQMDLNEDGSLQIEESIEVNFSELRHGIYREIPLGKEGDYLNIENIKSNKNIHNNTTKNNVLSIQLGNPNITVQGNQTYTITYTIKNGIKTFSGNDELYRNIIGSQRNTTIDRTTWTINLPKEYRSFSGSSFALWGGYGEQLTGGIIFEQTRPTQRRGSLDTQLQPGQGITIGLQFSGNYFTLPENYDDYFIQYNSTNNQSSSTGFDIRDTIGGILQGGRRLLIPIISFIVRSIKKNSNNWKSKKPITTQYEPPKNIEPSYAFYLWHNSRYEPKIFTALLYYWATHGWAVIQKQNNDGISSRLKKSDMYSIIETSLRPEGTSKLDDTLLQEFFGSYDTTIDTVPLSESSHYKIKRLISRLYHQFKDQGLTQNKKGFWGWLGFKELTTKGLNVFEHLRGYKEYLSKVEQPVIESELKSDPEFLNKILPWAVLFGVETRLLTMVEELLKDVQWYQSNDGTYLTAHTFRSMNKSFASFAVPPRSSGSSGFSSGGGGFSGGGRGGGGGGSR